MREFMTLDGSGKTAGGHSDREEPVRRPASRVNVPMQSEDRVDKRRNGRSLRQDDKAAQQNEHYHNRQQPEFLPDPHELPKFPDKTNHFLTCSLSWYLFHACPISIPYRGQSLFRALLSLLSRNHKC